MTFFKWSRTAASNATADSTCPFPEGMAASALNDGTRGMMAAAAKYRDDIAGAIVTGGTSTAYTVATYEVYGLLTDLNGQMIAFTPHVTNGATVTLAVDGGATKPLRSAPNTELPAGVLIQGTPYCATYNNADGCFYLRGFYGNPYNMPLGGGLIFFGSAAPNSAFAFPFGQAISRTTFAALFGLISTTYGAGDGVNTFNLPDMRGRVPAGKDNMGGVAAGVLTTTTYPNGPTNLGAPGGSETHTLTAAEIPSITSAVSTTNNTANLVSANSGVSLFSTGSSGATVWEAFSNGAVVTVNPSVTAAGTAVSNNTSGLAHSIVQPTSIVNFIMRII